MFESDTADACRSVRTGQEGLNGGSEVGWSLSALGGEDSPEFLVLFRDTPIVLIPPVPPLLDRELQ